ncbi:type II toxin-antitoxin system RelE family toxin [Thiosulfativibrio zosterae]|uniref:Cytotoxic translational repressor of toxin-antitoxin stability system n=1 Tax=Thiosulfativibrio zosterae TaxID=2675053 RepID=A0A6F8PRA4_9GAMM|nr:type II toxin-antitoxin system RelE/ParE family toxin [Thiosulfativibrio zosterae]BBP44558.1 cytotoxic translational repressor of toxin-antitoxin stability system [Thiosulfativibrio zosterae]
MQVEWKNKARKQLKKLNNPQVISRILRGIDALESDQPNIDLITLTNHEYSHRLRVGDYRVFLNIDEVIEIAFIEEVKKRDERTY